MSTSSTFATRTAAVTAALTKHGALGTEPSDMFLSTVFEELDVPKEETGSLLSAVFTMRLEELDAAFDGLAQTPEGLKALGWLLDVAIECAKHGVSDPATPFALLEEAMEATPIAHCEAVWGVLESRRDQLTLPIFLPPNRNTKSKLALLRIANGLLRRLSKTQSTVFCGRILMFLAYVYPLSERSGVNVTGVFNKDNVTDFSEESEVASDAAGAVAASPKAPVDRALHRCLWRLQSYMIEPVRATASADAWKGFTSAVATVLSAFEAQKLEGSSGGKRSSGSSTSARRRSSSVDADAGNTSDDQFYCVKYLTNSSLLPLQLRDAQLRRHVLLQLLILAQYLPKARTQPAGVSVEAELRKPIQRVWALLADTPPDGGEFVAVVKRLLEREQAWTRWKDEGKCAPYERSELEAAPKPIPGLGANRKAKKHALMARVWTSKVAALDYLKLAAEQKDGRRPTLEGYLEPYREAIDPDNEIDDEYNPKHNKMYVWKGQRLLAAQHLRLMSDAPAFDELITKLDNELKKPAKAAAPASGAGNGAGAGASAGAGAEAGASATPAEADAGKDGGEASRPAAVKRSAESDAPAEKERAAKRARPSSDDATTGDATA